MAQLKNPVYALEHPQAPGKYYRLDGKQPRLTPLESSRLAPHSSGGREWILEGSARLAFAGLEHELVRLDA